MSIPERRDFGRYQRVDDATVPVRLEDVERVGIVGMFSTEPAKQQLPVKMCANDPFEHRAGLTVNDGWRDRRVKASHA